MIIRSRYRIESSLIVTEHCLKNNCITKSKRYLVHPWEGRNEEYDPSTYDAKPRLNEPRLFINQTNRGSSDERKDTKDQIQHLILSCLVHHPTSEYRTSRHRQAIREKVCPCPSIKEVSGADRMHDSPAVDALVNSTVWNHRGKK